MLCANFRKNQCGNTALVVKNVRCTVREILETYTKAQYKILCRLIKQKHITKEFFYFMIEQIFDLSDWKWMDYRQMYKMIHILTFYDYKKESVSHE